MVLWKLSSEMSSETWNGEDGGERRRGRGSERRVRAPCLMGLAMVLMVLMMVLMARLDHSICVLRSTGSSWPKQTRISDLAPVASTHGPRGQASLSSLSGLWWPSAAWTVWRRGLGRADRPKEPIAWLSSCAQRSELPCLVRLKGERAG